MGYECEQECSAGTWGPNCLFECFNCVKCNIFTGDCYCTAVNKKGKQCNECVDGYYGHECIDKCSDDCISCDQINGTCILFSNKTKNDDCQLDFVNDCTVVTHQYQVKEFKLSSNSLLSLICVLKYFDSKDSCDQIYKDFCGLNPFFELKENSEHSHENCLNLSRYLDDDQVYLGI